MAGDWIKFECNTPDKPEVWVIADACKLDPDAVVGKLLRVWSWFDQHTSDGNAPSVTQTLLDRLVGVPGFCEAVISTGWMLSDGKVLTLPNFDRHNGQTAKQRALTSKRVARHKAQGNAKGNAASVKDALPREEKRREEKNNGGTPPNPPIGEVGVNAVQGDPAEAVTWDPADVEIPEPLRDDPAFQAQWADWLFHLQDKHRPPSRAQCKAQLAQLATLEPRRATQVLIEHLTAGWLSLDINREPSKRSSGSGKPARKVPIFRGARQEAASA